MKKYSTRLIAIAALIITATTLLATSQYTVRIFSSVPESLGTVRLNLTTGSRTTTINGVGTYSVDVSSSVVSVTINNQTVAAGSTGYVLLPSRTRIRVEWDQTNICIWVDTDDD